MASGCRVPTITQDDLKAFQARNFPTNANVPEDHHQSREDFYEDEDDLGYYPDGVKRTLTDEQIAMFRNSEIYALYRERQVRKENLEADFELLPEVSALGSSLATGTKAASISEVQNEVVAEVDSDNEEEYARFLEAEKREADAAHTRKKRKMSHASGYDNRGRPATHRRIARELDIVAADEQVLDYGEESSKSTDITKNTTITIREELFEDHAPSPQLHESSRAALQKHRLPVEGKKIWWPLIGN